MPCQVKERKGFVACFFHYCFAENTLLSPPKTRLSIELVDSQGSGNQRHSSSNRRIHRRGHRARTEGEAETTKTKLA